MKALRHLAIERFLADWFRRNGWEVAGCTATMWVEDAEDAVEISLDRLANDLDADFDHIAGKS